MAEQQHYSIVVLDVEQSGQMTMLEKHQTRADLYSMLRRAGEVAEIPADATIQEDRGDGVYLLFAAGVPKQKIIGPLLRALDEALADRRTGDVRLRLRVAVSSGEVGLDAHGSMGPAVDATFAVLDAPVLKQTIAVDPSARMVIAIDDDLYRSVVRGRTWPDPTAFRLRTLDTKYGERRIWVTATGTDSQPVPPAAEEPSTSRVPARAVVPTMTVHQGEQHWAVSGANARVAGTVNGDANFGDGPTSR